MGKTEHGGCHGSRSPTSAASGALVSRGADENHITEKRVGTKTHERCYLRQSGGDKKKLVVTKPMGQRKREE